MPGPGRVRKLFAAACVTLALLAVPTAATAQTGWKVTQVADGSVMALFWGVSCPSPSLCVAVGTNGTIATSTDPGGGASTWSAVHPEGYFEPAIPGPTSYPGNAMKGVSCPTTGFCAVAGPQGNIWASADPTGPVGAWVLADLGLEATHMNAISCPSQGLCVAVSQHGKVITSTDPLGGTAAWKVTELAQPFNMRGVSCPSPSLCVAVDFDGNIVTSTDPTGGAAAWNPTPAPAGPERLNGVSCPAPSLCVTANPGQMISSTSPTAGASAWKAVTAGTGLPVTGVSCPSVSACVAVDNNADVIVSTDPSGGPAAWSFTNVIPSREAEGGDSNAMNGISCPTASFCAAAGVDRKLITSSDPFGSVPVQGGKKKKRRHSKRPRVRIVSHPLKRTNFRKGLRVGFRFRGVGTVARFRCKFDRGRFWGCRSPSRYRAGVGKHFFKVRAIGPSGVRGPITTYHFRVGPILEPPPYVPCDPTEMRAGSRPCGGPR
jgi:hypothetical protein